MKKQLHIIFYSLLFVCVDIYAQSVNFDFELTSPGTYTSSNAVSGWTISSQTVTSCASSTVWTPGSPEFSIITTPILFVPNIGLLPNSPLGGSNIARLNNSIANRSSTKLAQTISVTYSNTYFCYAFAGMWQNGNHNCCEQSSFKIQVKNLSGILLSCQTQSLVTPTCNSATTFTLNSGTYWSNWQTMYMDLFSYIGLNVTIEIVCGDCTLGDHYGTLFFDASNPTNSVWGCLPINQVTNILENNYCSGSNATLSAPQGFASYSWFGPVGYPISVSQSSLSTITLTNAVPGNVYSLTLVHPNGCSYSSTDTLFSTPITIAAIGSSPSCSLGASGSATVVGNGSSISGYSYQWISPTNSPIGTSSTITNLSPGIYSVIVSALGSQSLSCGSVTATTTIGISAPSVINQLKPYCNNEAYFSMQGSNFHWYNNLSAISPTNGGTASNYTVTSPVNGSVYYLSYLSPQGCQDSIKFTLVPTSAGNLTITSNPLVCAGTNNAAVTLSMNPAPGSTAGLNSFSVFSTGTTSAYSTTLFPTAFTSFTASGLSAGGTYSVNAFDGSCKYSTNFSVTPLIFNYTLTPTTVFTLCPGGSINAAVTFTSPSSYSQYTYSWSPSTFLIGTNAPNTIINPVIVPGTSLTMTYTVVVTSTLANCSLTKTLSITAANPSTPTINPIPPLCSKASQYSITANPSNGTFINGTNICIGPATGILTPSLALIGLNTFTYANSIGTCVARSSGSFVIKATPSIVISGNTAICEGQSTTLLANGADSYTWSNSSVSPFITLTPSLTNTYIVEGTNLNTHCSDIKSITVSVVPHPTVTISGDTLICLGQSTTLTANGANSYNWNNGSSNQVQIISPIATSSYSVIGTTSLASCSNTQSILVKVITCTQTGINEWTTQEEINIYPNPTNGKLIIETKNEIKIWLHNQLGQLLFEETIEKGNYNLDLSNYPDGIYLLKIDYKGEIKIIKVVKKD